MLPSGLNTDGGLSGDGCRIGDVSESKYGEPISGSRELTELMSGEKIALPL